MILALRREDREVHKNWMQSGNRLDSHRGVEKILKIGSLMQWQPRLRRKVDLCEA